MGTKTGDFSKGRKRRARQAWIGALLVILNLAALNVLGSLWFARWDLTENKIYTLSPDTVGILGRMDDLVTIHCYLTRDLPPGYIEYTDQTRDLLEEFRIAAGDRLQIVFQDPSGDPQAALEAEQYGIPKVPLPQLGSESYEEKLAYIGLVVLYEDRFETIPVVVDPMRLEYDLLMRIVRVMEKRPSVVAFDGGGKKPPPNLTPGLEAQFEGRDRTPGRHDIEGDYKEIAAHLRKRYDVETVDLQEAVPAYVRTLVVANPEGLDEVARYHVDQFIMAGGRVALLLSGVDFDLNQSLAGKPRDDRLDDWLAHYGIEVGKNLVLDRQCTMVRFTSGLGSVSRAYPPFLRLTRDGIDPDSPVTSGLAEMMIPLCSSIRLMATEGARPKVLLRSSDQAWLEEERFLLDPEAIRMPGENQLGRFDLAGTLEGEFISYFAASPVPDSILPEGRASEGGNIIHPPGMLLKSQRTILFVAGSSDFIGSRMPLIDRDLQGYAYQFFINAVDFLTTGEEFGDIRTRERRSRYIEPRFREDSRAVALLKVIGTAAGAFLVVCFGLLRFYLRR